MTPNVRGYAQCLEDATNLMLSRARRQEHHRSREQAAFRGLGPADDFNELAERLYRVHNDIAAERQSYADPVHAAAWLPLVDRIRDLVDEHKQRAEGGRKNLKHDHAAVRAFEAELISQGIDDPGERNRKIERRFPMPKSSLRRILQRNAKPKGDRM
jgi:hypothetical protein